MTQAFDLPLQTAFSPDAPTRVGVAVSGGSDSLALLFLLARHFAVEVVTVDHGLRVEAAEEARFVGEICARHGWPHQVLRWQAPEGGNLMQEARRGRARLIGAWAQGRGLRHVALGHTADDVAETFLMRLGRASGLKGLTGMRALWQAEGVLWARPLLGTTRARLRQYLQAQGQVWVDDPSNENPRYLRVRARNALKTLAPLGITAESLSLVTAHLAQADAALEQSLAEFVARHVAEQAGDLLVAAEPLQTLPQELALRLLARALLWVNPAEFPPRAAALERLLAALAGDFTTRCLGGVHLSLKQGQLRLTREAAKLPPPSPSLRWDRWQLLGPEGLTLKALGPEGLRLTDWRAHLPRASALAAPSLWQGETLLASPLTGLPNGYQVQIAHGSFAQTLFSR